MTKQRFKLTTAILALVSVSLFVYSCLKQEFINHVKTELNENFTLSEARSLFESNAKDLRLVEFSYSHKSDLKTKSANMSENVIPDWDKAVQTTNSNSIMFEIPFKQNAKSSAILISKSDSIVTYLKKVTVESSLVIQKFPEIDTVRYFVVTVLGEYIGNEDINKANPFCYNGDRKGFEGYVIISDLDGCVLDTYYYAKGGRKHVRIKPETEANTFSKYTIIRMSKISALTKGGGYESGEDVFPCDIPGCAGQVVDGVCNACGVRYIAGVIVEDDAEYCSECNQFIGQCICCSVCHRLPCICNDPVPCPYCEDPYCNGECQTFHFCTNCGTELVNGSCPSCNGQPNGDPPPGDGKEDPPTPVPDTLYTLTVNIEGSGTVTGGRAYKKGEVATATGIPNQGSIFLGWTGAISSSSSSVDVTMDSDKSLTAIFLEIANYFFSFDTYSNSNTMKNIMSTIYNNCSGKYLMDSIYNIYGKLSIAYNSSMQPMSTFNTGTHVISWNFYLEGGDADSFFIHELVHAYQHGVGYLESKTINAEVEAFLAQYKYGINTGKDHFYGNKTFSQWNETFGTYLQNPSEENYAAMVAFVRDFPDYASTTTFPDDPSKRTVTNFTNIFNCNQ